MTYEAQHDSDNLWYVAQKDESGEIVNVFKVFCNVNANTAEDAIAAVSQPTQE